MFFRVLEKINDLISLMLNLLPQKHNATARGKTLKHDFSIQNDPESHVVNSFLCPFGIYRNFFKVCVILTLMSLYFL